jgi:hypothetical protein
VQAILYPVLASYSQCMCVLCSWIPPCRQAAVAGSLSPSYSGPTGQKNDLAIIEVALFFR